MHRGDFCRSIQQDSAREDIQQDSAGEDIRQDSAREDNLIVTIIYGINAGHNSKYLSGLIQQSLLHLAIHCVLGHLLYMHFVCS